MTQPELPSESVATRDRREALYDVGDVPRVDVKVFASDEAATQPAEADRHIRRLESWILSAGRTLDDLAAWINASMRDVFEGTTVSSPEGFKLPLGMDRDSGMAREVALWIVGVARGRSDARGYERTGEPDTNALAQILQIECWLLQPDRTLEEVSNWVRGALFQVLGMTSRWLPPGGEIQDPNGAVDVPDEITPFVQDLDHQRHLALWLVGVARGFAESGVALPRASGESGSGERAQ